jgi:hypothetical protein
MEWILGIVGTAAVAFLTAWLTSRRELALFKEENKLDFSVETAIIHLLRNPNYKKRGLKKIKHHLRGFENDNDLRMALIRAGAVAFSDKGGDEIWGLLSRNEDDIK